LGSVVVGDDPASLIYQRGKGKAAAEAGIEWFYKQLPADVGQDALLQVVSEMAADDRVDGILVQSPLPAGYDYDYRQVVKAIPAGKDVDGFHAENVGGVATDGSGIPGCTAAGIMVLLDHAGVQIRGANATVVGRSSIVGRPASYLLLARDATVTVAHRHTRDLAAVTRTADILIVAVGKPGLITGDMVKPGAVVIDVGINRTEDGICGDVDFASVSEVASAITPVPGGVGPMTIAMLLANTLMAAERSAGITTW
jgi:methylenetetrahydrofolate dehydrogenase (NADP+)/methenyltetrahydrofolate cyclohydrolase